MGELSRAEMQWEHEVALRSPQYRMEGMFDVLAEEMMMLMPSGVEVTRRVLAPETEVRFLAGQPSPCLEREVTSLRRDYSFLLKELNTLKEIRTNANRKRNKY